MSPAPPAPVPAPEPGLLLGPGYARTAAALIAALACLALAATGPDPGSGSPGAVDRAALDLLFQLRHARRGPGPGPDPTLVLVGIDDASIRARGLAGQAWPRSLLAELVEAASRGGARVIGLDLLLLGASGTTPEALREDTLLAEAIGRAGNVVLADRPAGAGLPALDPAPAFAAAAWATGFIDLPLDPDGFVRTAPVRRGPGPDGADRLSFAARLAEAYRLGPARDEELARLAAAGTRGPEAETLAGTRAMARALFTEGPGGSLRQGERQVPLRRDGLLQLDFRARSPAFAYLSAEQVLGAGPDGLPGEPFRDRIAIVAPASLLAGDHFPTPLFEPAWPARLANRGDDPAPRRTSGAELHATAVATLLSGTPPVPAPAPVAAAYLALVLVPAGAALVSLAPPLALAGSALAALAALGLAHAAFVARALVLPLGQAALALAVLVPLGLALRYARERARRARSEAEKTRVMEIFARCVSPAVAEELWRQRDRASLAGERRVVTVIFTDIRGFTSISEGSSSDAVVEWLNDYFGRMNEVVTAAGGHINKFLGDGLMIVFGAPTSRGPAAEARAAVDCATRMLDAVEELDRAWQGTSRPRIRIGVGIHSGEATCGVVGSTRRLEYTVIGDTVNLASRLESKTKDLCVDLLLSQATATLLGESPGLRALGSVEVKGKAAAVPVYTVERPKGA